VPLVRPARVVARGGALVTVGRAARVYRELDADVAHDSLTTPEREGEAATNALLRPAFGLHRLEWPHDASVEFHLTHAEWIRVLRSAGFEIEALLEVKPPAHATSSWDFVTLEWARKWPCEEVWKVRKRV